MVEIERDEQQERGKRFWNRRGVSLALKIGVSGILLVFILWKIELRQVAELLDDFRWGHAIWAIVLFGYSNVVGAVQWDMLLKGQGIRLPMKRVMSFYFVGLYFSNFLPGYVGGDVIRVYDVHRSGGQTESAVAATLFDRIFGLVALALLAVVAALSSPLVLQNEVVMISGLVLAVALAVVLGIVFSKRAARSMEWALRPSWLSGLRTRLKAIYESAYGYRSQPRLLWAATGVAVIVQVLRVLVHYEVAMALGIEISIRYYFLFVPVIAILIALPTSIGGMGVREGAGILFFRQVGVSSAGAALMGFLAFLVGIAVSLIGGAMFILRGPIERKIAREVEALGEPSRQS